MSKDKILLVEDEPDLLQTLAFNFESEGYKVKKAVSYTHLTLPTKA